MAEAQAETTEREEDAFDLDRKVIAAVMDAVGASDANRVTELLDPLHAADIADILEQIGPANRRALLDLWSGQIDGDILSELDESIREEVIDYLPRDVLADAVRELDSDDVVDLLEDLEAPQKEMILDALEDADRAAVEQSLTYPESSAGRLMQREVVTAPEHWSVGQTIDFLRNVDWLPEQFYHVILVDPLHHPTGYVTLGKILSANRTTALTEVTEETFRTIDVKEEEGDVAYAFNQYHLISAPVVDETGRLVGIITIDDAMSVLDEEHEEDILRLAGVGDESLSDRVFETAKLRFVWLFVNLMTAILASVVIGAFSDTIETHIALAVLMPIVASMGGNAGTQSMTVAVRSIATRDLTVRNAWRVIRRELAVGALNGLGFGLIMAGVAGFWFGIPMLSVVIAVAMLLTLIAAAMGGIVIPILLDRFGIDPALASGPFVTTVTDVIGFFAFLGLAAALLL
jgi:magnesium transporter